MQLEAEILSLLGRVNRLEANAKNTVKVAVPGQAAPAIIPISNNITYDMAVPFTFCPSTTAGAMRIRSGNVHTIGGVRYDADHSVLPAGFATVGGITNDRYFDVTVTATTYIWIQVHRISTKWRWVTTTAYDISSEDCYNCPFIEMIPIAVIPWDNDPGGSPSTPGIKISSFTKFHVGGDVEIQDVPTASFDVQANDTEFLPILLKFTGEVIIHLADSSTTVSMTSETATLHNGTNIVYVKLDITDEGNPDATIFLNADEADPAPEETEFIKYFAIWSFEYDGATEYITNAIQYVHGDIHFFKSGGESDYHFKVTDMGSGTVQVRIGDWTRRGIITSLAPDAPGGTFQTLTSVGENDYVVLSLTFESPYDAALLPASALVVFATPTHPVDDTTFNLMWVLGKFTAGVWEPYWKGGDIDDWMVRPDGLPYDSPTARYTINENPTTDNPNKGELQLYGVDTVKPDAYSIPYFDAGTGLPVTGSLAWATIDSHDTKTLATQYSLEVLNPGAGTGMLQLFAFDDGGTALVTGLTYNDFYTASPTEAKLAMLVRDNTGSVPTLRYASLKEFEAASAANNDGWITKEQADGYYWNTNGDETTCKGSKIANVANAVQINLTDSQLYNIAGSPCVDWALGTMSSDDAAPILIANWFEQKLYDGEALTKLSANWNTRKLYDTDGTTVMLDWNQGILEGNWYCNGDLLPWADDTFDLGSTLKYWNSAYIGVLHTDSIYTGKVGTGINCFDDVLPSADATYDLGSSTSYWAEGRIKKVFANELDAAGATSVTCKTHLISDGAMYSLGVEDSEWYSLLLGSTGFIRINGTTVMKTQRTFSPAALSDSTAGATYGTTEQTMLKEAHDCIRLLMVALRDHGMIS